jgi:dolichol-phosphate mannosyltransferase
LNISIIIPCYNEAENIVDAVSMVINGIGDALSAFEIIIVDDGSVDGSRDLISALLEKDARISALFHPQNRGKGAALRSGFEQARMEWVLMMDADLQIDIAELEMFLPYTADYDVIAGVRIGRKEGFARYIVSKTYNFLVSIVAGERINDVGCPFKLLRASMVRTLSLTSAGFAIDAEIFHAVSRLRYRVREVHVNCQPRVKGESKVKLRHLYETFIDLFLLKTKRKQNQQDLRGF